jgi:hypothetical protein
MRRTSGPHFRPDPVFGKKTFVTGFGFMGNVKKSPVTGFGFIGAEKKPWSPGLDCWDRKKIFGHRV